jgi:hypothetical protein
MGIEHTLVGKELLGNVLESSVLFGKRAKVLETVLEGQTFRPPHVDLWRWLGLEFGDEGQRSETNWQAKSEVLRREGEHRPCQC